MEPTAEGEANQGRGHGTVLEADRALNTQGLSGTDQAMPTCSVSVFLPPAWFVGFSLQSEEDG